MKKKQKTIRTWHVTSSSKDDTLGKWSWFSINTFHIDAVQSLSCARLVSTPRTAARQASLSFTTSWSLLKLMSIESMMPSHHLNLCHPLLLLPSILSSIRVFSNESALHIRWAKYCSSSFSISPAMNIQDWSPSGETSWISFSSPAVWKTGSQCSVFFTVHLSHPYLTTGKNHSFGYVDLWQQSNVSAF